MDRLFFFFFAYANFVSDLTNLNYFTPSPEGLGG